MKNKSDEPDFLVSKMASNGWRAGFSDSLGGVEIEITITISVSVTAAAGRGPADRNHKREPASAYAADTRLQV